MHGSVAGRGIAHAGRHMVILLAALGRNFDPGADPVVVALGSFKGDIQPMPGTWASIHPDFGWAGESGSHYVNAAVAVQVAKRQAPVAHRRRGIQSRLGRQRFPASAGTQIPADTVLLIDPGAWQRPGD